MSIETHLESLEQKHSLLETEIHAAMAAPSIDDLTIADLKRKKLLLKDEIERLKARPI